MSISGIGQFEEFAEDVRSIDVDAAIERAVEATAEDYVDTLTGIIRRESTSKGGTLDSRTSPYSPGGTNDSSDDSLHISDNSGWEIDGEGKRVTVRPKEAVADRAKFLEKGTQAHGPADETPMHFYVNGLHIVVADKSDRSSPQYQPYIEMSAVRSEEDARFTYGEPGEVEGVEAQNFFSRAAIRLRENRRFIENLKDELDKEVEEAGLN